VSHFIFDVSRWTENQKKHVSAIHGKYYTKYGENISKYGENIFKIDL
jgi:hypothetical protein